MTSHVLVIEPNDVYRSVIAHVVQMADSDCDTVASVEEGRALLDTRRFDLVVLGVTAEQVPDPVVVARIRSLSRSSLIILSDSYEQSLDAYEAGAEQILPKPFVPEALLGAVRTELRGSKSIVPLATRIDVGGIVFDATRRALSTDELTIQFTRREWALVVLLLNRVNEFVDTTEMLTRAWGDGASPEQLRTYVGRIRHKLSPISPACQILSERGLGYCLTVRTPARDEPTLEAVADVE